MRVRCTSIPQGHANAVGNLELECLPSGLLVHHVALHKHRAGYAPGLATGGTTLRVPWAEVQVEVVGELICLAFAERLSPLNRLSLERFALPATAQPPRRRWLLWSMRLALGGAFLLLGWELLSARSSLGPRVSLGLLVLAGLLLVGYGAAAEGAGPFSRPDSAQVRQLFLADLQRFVAHPIQLSPAPPARRDDRRPLYERLPRSVIGIAITLSAAILAALVTGIAVGERPEVRTAALAPRPKRLQPAVGAPRSEHGSSPAVPPPPRQEGQKQAIELGASCDCARADSSLWQTPISRLTPIILDRRTRAHGAHHHTEVELAVVNNGERSLREIHLSVMFSQGDGSRAPRVERPLYFEGPLGAGRAIKWTVEARGDRFQVLAPDLGSIAADGDDAAGADAFFELTEAHHRPVRLHALRLLAYLNDPRTQKAAMKLQLAAVPREEPFFEELRRTLGDVRTCDVEVSQRTPSKLQVSACLFNSSGTPAKKLDIALVTQAGTLDPGEPTGPPPQPLQEHLRSVRQPLNAHQGRRVDFIAPVDVVQSSPSQTQRSYHLTATAK